VRRLPLPARRVFRLGLATALALACGYGLGRPLPYMAPILALVLTAIPAPPLRLKGLVILLVLVLVTSGLGLLLVPVLIHYRVVGLIVVVLGLYLANDLSLNRGKGPVGTFLTVGLTLITAAGVADFASALMVAEEMVVGIVLAVICQRIVYPLFPEDPPPLGSAAKPKPNAEASSWLAVRTTIIVIPAYFLSLINPLMYLSIIMKAVSLGQQSSALDARSAGRELLASTFFGGCFAVVFWFALKLHPDLLMFALWMLLFGLLIGAKMFGVSASHYPPSFWQNVGVTMLILVGPAVADSANGKDPYTAFAVRLSLFVAVTLYAWAAIVVLEHLRTWRRSRRAASTALLGDIDSPV
jgi:dipeptide/tripeptide permease